MSNLSLSFSFYFWWINSSQSYTLTNSLTQTINVFPDNAFYWSGNEIETLGISGYTVGSTIVAATKDTNKIVLNGQDNKCVMLGTDNAINLSNFSTLKVRGNTLGSTDNYGLLVYITSSKTNFTQSPVANGIEFGKAQASEDTVIKQADVSAVSSSAYIVFVTNNSYGRLGKVFDAWFE